LADVDIIEGETVQYTVGLVIAVATECNPEDDEIPFGRRNLVKTESRIAPTVGLARPGKPVFASDSAGKVFAVIPVDTALFSIPDGSPGSASVRRVLNDRTVKVLL